MRRAPNAATTGRQRSGNGSKKGEKNGPKRLACVGGVYSTAPFRRTAEDVVNEMLRKEKQQQRAAWSSSALRVL